ncbi:hypothetical protein C8Q78DRAFT_388345 [Trametes maxima]|nr:hypothetical protein C8Q78DRAFT_388345 [Trametes maxima]
MSSGRLRRWPIWQAVFLRAIAPAPVGSGAENTTRTMCARRCMSPESALGAPSSPGRASSKHASPSRPESDVLSVAYGLSVLWLPDASPTVMNSDVVAVEQPETEVGGTEAEKVHYMLRAAAPASGLECAPPCLPPADPGPCSSRLDVRTPRGSRGTRPLPLISGPLLGDNTDKMLRSGSPLSSAGLSSAPELDRSSLPLPPWPWCLGWGDPACTSRSGGYKWWSWFCPTPHRAHTPRHQRGFTLRHASLRRQF